MESYSVCNQTSMITVRIGRHEILILMQFIIKNYFFREINSQGMKEGEIFMKSPTKEG